MRHTPWFFLALAGFISHASARENVTYANVNYTVHVLSAITGEHTDEVSFAKTVGRVLNQYSSRTDFEACAEICRAPNGTWGSQPVSIGAHASCLTNNQCPKGMRPVGRTIHSHPTTRLFLANATDFSIWRKPYQANTWVTADDPALFSDSDFIRPGYLVVFGQLSFQNGPRDIRRLGSVLSGKTDPGLEAGGP